jgi:cellulose synthase/poly-beta-1,6-N-acetylglucosamine synthase-like glycosyltransferase
MKRIASSICKGKYLVELDHDDYLRDDALKEILKEFKKDNTVGMVYSNDVHFKDDGTFVK